MTNKLHKYIVSGRGPFPLDMLRYDSCWPTSSDDVALMDGHGNRSISMTGISEPTEERWVSFQWVVLEQGKVR